MLPTATLLADLRRRAFAPSAGPPRIGVEAEFLLLDADTRLPVPLHAASGTASLPLLRRFAREAGWTEEDTGYGAPRWHHRRIGVLSYEPGGQIELSSVPFHSATALLAALRSILLPLRRMAAEAGIEMLGAGIDPFNPLERAPLLLHGERYRRMDAYLSRRGPAGPRMMRQTASLQVNLDWGPEEEAWLRWRVLNAAAPHLLAIFANSPRYAGDATGHASFRAAQWRALDPARTGVLRCGPDAAAEYLEWALRAPAILLPGGGSQPRPFGEETGRREVGLADWHAHLSTLFPEVRPKGHLELRTLDAVEPEHFAAAVALLAGLLYAPGSLRAATELLGAPSNVRLARAGEAGLADPLLARTASELWEIALDGCEALGSGFIDGATLEQARDFAERFTRRQRAPADEIRPAALC
ncbi:MAG: glutamate-cysteine ligase family protein [Gemmatimonadota bacterium]|nr:glutamate-cysteine ligase family protein [Gemmatimonadota bacterium]